MMAGADSEEEEEGDDDRNMGLRKGLSLPFKRRGGQAGRVPKDLRNVPPCYKVGLGSEAQCLALYRSTHLTKARCCCCQHLFGA